VRKFKTYLVMPCRITLFTQFHELHKDLSK